MVEGSDVRLLCNRDVCRKFCTHLNCPGLHCARGVCNFNVPACVEGDTVGKKSYDILEVDGGTRREVQQISYFSDMLDSEAMAERAVRARVTSTWLKWRDIANILLNKNIHSTELEFVKLVSDPY